MHKCSFWCVCVLSMPLLAIGHRVLKCLVCMLKVDNHKMCPQSQLISWIMAWGYGKLTHIQTHITYMYVRTLYVCMCVCMCLSVCMSHFTSCECTCTCTSIGYSWQSFITPIILVLMPLWLLTYTSKMFL